MDIVLVFIVSSVLITNSEADLIKYDDVNGCIGNICYNDPSYPHEEIQDMWSKDSNSFSRTFGNLHTRQGRPTVHSRNTCELCPTKTNLKIQLLSITDQNEKLYVARTQKYNPEIKVEVCQDKANCTLKNKPDDFSTNCIQKTTSINLLTYNKTAKKFLTIAVRYPSGCECILYGR